MDFNFEQRASTMPAVRQGLAVYESAGVQCYSQSDPINLSDGKEYIAYAKTRENRVASPGSELFDDLVFKASSIKSFNELMPTLGLSGSERVLEMGAGQAWASVLVKRTYPSCHVIASDLVPAALDFTPRYEQLLGVHLDEKWAFNSRDIPFEDNQIDCIFTFAAIHHFGDAGDFGPALSETLRVLKPGCKIVLLYEPSSPRYLYRTMHKLANKRRVSDGVDEDVLVPGRLRQYGERLGSSVETSFYPSARHRDSIKSSLHYSLLSKLSLLHSLTVCTINVVIHKVEHA